MAVYYNEHDPQAAAWLRELISRGLLPAGDVDERDIRDVTPEEIRDYVQCHFFAGIGGWPAALKWIVGWPDDRPVWTGSCPCQPFSGAGKGKGFADERHLWPSFFHLISECRPAILFGEQVTTRLDWLDLVSSDLEAAGYAIGAADLCAASVASPHIRQRLFFGANDLHADGLADSYSRLTGIARDTGSAESEGVQCGTESDGRSRSGGLADAAAQGCTSGPGHSDQGSGRLGRGIATDQRMADGVGDTDDAGSQGREVRGNGGYEWASGETSMAEWLADPDCTVAELLTREGSRPAKAKGWGPHRQFDRRSELVKGLVGTSPIGNEWSDVDWLYGKDGKWRPVESGTFPLADGLPERVGRLRGYGNAIVPKVAAEFIEAYIQAFEDIGRDVA